MLLCQCSSQQIWDFYISGSNLSSTIYKPAWPRFLCRILDPISVLFHYSQGAGPKVTRFFCTVIQGALFLLWNPYPGSLIFKSQLPKIYFLTVQIPCFQAERPENCQPLYQSTLLSHFCHAGSEVCNPGAENAIFSFLIYTALTSCRTYNTRSCAAPLFPYGKTRKLPVLMNVYNLIPGVSSWGWKCNPGEEPACPSSPCRTSDPVAVLFSLSKPQDQKFTSFIFCVLSNTKCWSHTMDVTCPPGAKSAYCHLPNRNPYPVAV